MFELISRSPSRYYLAYGSNLDMERMGKRCPYAVVVGTTEIKGYRLLFKKSKTGCYATIEQDANESVPAVVWKLSEYDELLLDRYEGCPRYYYKKQFQLPVWNLNGNRMKKAKPCIAYVMHEDRRLGCPDAEYFELLRGGYSDWEFPLDTLKRGLAASIGRTEAIRYLKKQQMMYEYTIKSKKHCAVYDAHRP